MIEVGWILFLTRSFALCRKITLVSYIHCVRDKHNSNRVAKRDRRSYFEKFSGYNDDRGSTISYFPVLKLGKFHQNLKKPHTWVTAKKREIKMQRKIVFSFTLAAGCSTSNILRIVAPSLVIVTSPMSSTSIWKKRVANRVKHCQLYVRSNYRERERETTLSRPTGPNELLTMLATAWHATTALPEKWTNDVRNGCFVIRRGRRRI